MEGADFMATSKSQVKATAKYKAKAYKRIPLDVRIEEYEALEAYTKKTNQSINGFIRKIIKENIIAGQAEKGERR